MKNPLFVNKKVWRAFSSQELEEYKQKVYDFYKSPEPQGTGIFIKYLYVYKGPVLQG